MSHAVFAPIDVTLCRRLLITFPNSLDKDEGSKWLDIDHISEDFFANKKGTQEGPQALGRSSENCSSKSPAMNFDRSALSLRLYIENYVFPI